jgi:serine protease inhibitor
MEIQEELTRFFAGILKPIVQDAVAEEVPKYLVKKKERKYTIKQACQVLGVCEATFHNWANKGGIERMREGRNTVVDADVIDEAVASGELRKGKHWRVKR